MDTSNPVLDASPVRRPWPLVRTIQSLVANVRPRQRLGAALKPVQDLIASGKVQQGVRTTLTVAKNQVIAPTGTAPEILSEVIRRELQLRVISAAVLDALANSDLHAGLTFVHVSHRRRTEQALALLTPRQARSAGRTGVTTLALRLGFLLLGLVRKHMALRWLLQREQQHLERYAAFNCRLAQLAGPESDRVWQLVGSELLPEQERITSLVADLESRADEALSY